MKDISYIEKYKNLIRDIICSVTRKIKGSNFLHKAKQQLKFEKESDWAFLTSSLDLIGDTESAKKHFNQFHIDGSTKYDDIGEKYLRLYGILSAIYLQKNAILKLCEVFKLNQKAQIQKELNSLEIIKLRNIVASHTIDFREPGKVKAFMLVGFSLGKKKIVVIDENNKSSTYDIIEDIEKFNSKILQVLDKITQKAVKTIYKTNPKGKDEFLSKLERIRNERDGYTYIDISDRNNTIVIAPF